jgi:hypothetical protein
VLAFAAGCSSTPAPEQTRTVKGTLTAASMSGLDVPSVVAQDTNGATFDGPVAPDGSFSLKLPTNRTFRLFITDLRASGRQSTESRVLWPGQKAWASIPAADGTTSDGPSAIDVGAIRPFGVPAGASNVGGGAGANGGSIGGAGGGGPGTTTPGGATNGATSSSGGAGGGTSSGGGAGGGTSNGSTTDGTGGTSGGGSSGGDHGGGGDDTGGGDSHDGPSLCEPTHTSTSECTGAGSGLGGGGSAEFPVPPCTTNPGGGSSGGATPPSSSTPPAGAPQCEKDKVAVQDSRGRWDCVKMETPVTYFYSDKPIKVKAAVEFPRGVLTQWYPAAQDAYPMVAERDRIVATESKDKTCTAVGDAIGAANGLLDWGTLDILGRDQNVDAKLPYAALDRFTWSFARDVAANPVKTSSGQLEKFLFYRGVGNFSLPVKVTSQTGGRVALKNVHSDKIGAVYFLDVTADKGVFVQAHDGIAAGATLDGKIPSMDGAKDVETYADELARSVRTSLDEMGLYDDESTAMVNTWKRQWFRTPGARLLYIAPQSWTDASIPLTIDPKPESTKRVMVMRVELVTPELESADVSALKGLAKKDTAALARDHFASLGRFAEPRLRRAIAIAGDPAYAQPLLAETILTNHTTHTPTAGTKALVPNANGPKYAGKGFVVHEWGTDTIVVGSDGTQLLGLQHEEEDLPKFVYDRTKH